MLILFYNINIHNLTGDYYCMESNQKFNLFNDNKRNPCVGAIHEIKKFKHGTRISFAIFFLLVSSLAIVGHVDLIYDFGMPICIYALSNILLFKITMDGKLKLIKPNDLTAFENDIFEMIDECSRILELGKTVLSNIDETVIPTGTLVGIHDQYELFARSVSELDSLEFKKSISSKHFEQKITMLQFEGYYKFYRKLIRCNNASMKLKLIIECTNTKYPDMFK